MYQFSVEKWAFWDRLDTLEASENIFTGQPELAGINPMVKRRMPVMAKQIQQINQQMSIPAVPTVYASKNAELSRTIELIRQYSGDLSPASFSMSVHNAIPGLLSVINKDNSPYTVVDSMDGVLEMAMVEAYTLLQDHPWIKVIYFEERNAEVLQPLIDQKDIPMVLMLLISKGDQFSLSSKPISEQVYQSNTSNTKLFDFLAVLKGEQTQTDNSYQRTCWSLSRA